MVSKLTSEITRIAAGDDRQRYDGLEMTFHWLTALLVVTLFGLAETWDFAPRGSDTRHFMQNLHVSLGLSLTAVLLGRILWRIGPGRRVLPATKGLVEVASQIGPLRALRAARSARSRSGSCSDGPAMTP